MSEITLEGIAKTVEALLKQELDPIKETLAKHTELLNSHTASLEKLLTKKKSKDDENTVAVSRFDRLEKWAQLAGEKIGVKLEL
jgi:uncharacterized FlgJ-related protein